MLRRLFIVLTGTFIFCYAWSQSGLESNRSGEGSTTTSLHRSSTSHPLPDSNTSNTAFDAPQMSSRALLDVLFATNEDCELFINEESKGTVSKSQHKYIQLPPGSYVYKVKSRSIPEMLNERFSIKENGLNEIFIDLLYFIDEKNRQRNMVQNNTKAIEKPTLSSEKKAEQGTNTLQTAASSLLSNLVSITGGNFVMGNNKAPSEDESEHPVTVPSIRMSKYEVTQQQWESIMGYNPSLNKGCGTCPVENVSWEEVMKFIRKLNVTSNKKFRLPTEAEWEYAARFGGKTEIEEAGGPEEYIKRTAWYFGNSDKKTHPVGQKHPNAAGIYDLLGNVAEWCSDWYSATYYKEENNQKNPEGPPLGKEKVIRGGTYNDYTGDRFRPSMRNKLKPTGKSNDVGFRLVLEGE